MLEGGTMPRLSRVQPAFPPKYRLPEWSRPVPPFVPQGYSDPRCPLQCQGRDLPAPVPRLRAYIASLLRNRASAARHPEALARLSQMHSRSSSATLALSPRLTSVFPISSGPFEARGFCGVPCPFPVSSEEGRPCPNTNRMGSAITSGPGSTWLT